MPPPFADRTVTDKQIEAIRQWIAEGAKWQTHWAFTPPKRVEPPAKTANPIDAFIDVRLEQRRFEAEPRSGQAAR